MLVAPVSATGAAVAGGVAFGVGLGCGFAAGLGAGAGFGAAVVGGTVVGGVVVVVVASGASEGEPNSPFCAAAAIWSASALAESERSPPREAARSAVRCATANCGSLEFDDPDVDCIKNAAATIAAEPKIAGTIRRLRLRIVLNNRTFLRWVWVKRCATGVTHTGWAEHLLDCRLPNFRTTAHGKRGNRTTRIYVSYSFGF